MLADLSTSNEDERTQRAAENEKRCNLRRGPGEKSEQVVGYFPGNRYRTEQEADEEKFTLPVVTV